LALGAHTTPRTAARRETRNFVPLEKMRTWHGVIDEVFGPTKLPLSNLVSPVTFTVTAAAARMAAFRPTRRLQNVYAPPLSTRVPGPAPPPETTTSP